MSDNQSTIRIYRDDHRLLKDSARFAGMTMSDVIKESLALWMAAKRTQSPAFSVYLDERHPKAPP